MKFKSKHSFLLRDVILTGILFTGLMALIMFMIGAIATNYDRPDLVSQSFQDHYNQLNKMSVGVDSSRIALTNSNSTGLQLMGSVDIAFGATWNVINLVFSTINLYFSMGSNLVSDFTFIPSPVIYTMMIILSGLLLTYIIFSVISSVMRGRL